MKSATASHTYVVEPAILDRFPVDLSRRIARELLLGAFAGQPYSTEKTKGVADALRDRLKCAYILCFHSSIELTQYTDHSPLPHPSFYSSWCPTIQDFCSSNCL